MYLTLGKADGIINATPSKSHLIRLLFLSYMSVGDSFIKLTENEICDDVKDAMGVSRVFGKKAVLTKDGISVENSVSVNKCHIEGSAASLRFLLAFSGVLGKEIEITVGNTLFLRPHEELINVLNSNGAKTKITKNGFKTGGKLKAGAFTVSAEKSSQYISSLLLALPFADGDSVIRLDGKASSKPYISLTLSVLKGEGIDVREENNFFFVKGNNVLRSVNGICEGDWSSSAVFLCMGAVSGRVKVNGLSLSSFQGDKRICEILRRSGASIVADENSVTAEKSENRPFSEDMTDIPDLAPVLASYAVFCNGKSVLKNVSRLKYKESDRESFIKTAVSSSGNRVFEENGNIVIEKDVFSGFSADCLGDHRNAFMLALLSANGKIGISGEECVKKSCPSFFEKFVKIGGVIQ